MVIVELRQLIVLLGQQTGLFVPEIVALILQTVLRRQMALDQMMGQSSGLRTVRVPH